MSNAHRERSAGSKELTPRELGRRDNGRKALRSNADRMSRSFPSVHCGGTEEKFNFLFFDSELNTIKNTFWMNLKEKE